MKKTVALVLTLVTLLTLLVLPVSAAIEGVGVYGTDWVKYGDLDANQEVNAKDALSVLKNAVGKQEFNEVETLLADVNLDTAVNAKDALEILKYAVGKIGSFTAGNFYQITQEEPVPPAGNEETIASYDTGNSVNGAYETDPTADTSYSLDISDLPKNTCFSISSGVWSKQDGVADTNDIQRLLFSLQGLINRDFGKDADHTTLIYISGATEDSAWLKEMQKEGSIMYTNTTAGEGMNLVKITKYDAFMETFLPTIKKAGIVLWDGNVPATANVAATICGLDGYLPVLKKSPFNATLVALGVPVKLDLYGKFKDNRKGQKITGTSIDSTGSAKNDAYLWALDKYFNRCTTKFIGYTLDGAPTIKGYESYSDNPFSTMASSGSNCLSNHDYLIARRCFIFDLAPYKGDRACDDPAQQAGYAQVGQDYYTMVQILSRRYQRANGAWGAFMGFVPWWIKYTTNEGQGTKDSVWNEWLLSEIVTCYNLGKEADAAQPTNMFNGSFMYKYVPSTKQYTNNKKKENIAYDAGTYYYCIYVGDYDSSAWLKKHMYTYWLKGGSGDRNLNKVTLMWSFNPNLADRVPVVFDYMYKNKSDNHYFVGGDGGAGYIIPSGLFHDRTLANMGEMRPSGNAAAGNSFAQYSKVYYDRFDMDITGFLINGSNGAINTNIANCINQYSPVGSFVNAASAGYSKFGNTYYVNCYTGIAQTNAASTMYSFASGGVNRGLNFGAYRTICHTPSEILGNVNGFAEYAAGKGMRVKYCDPYTYFDLMKKAGK